MTTTTLPKMTTYDAIDARELDFYLHCDTVPIATCAEAMSARANGDALQVEAPPAHVRNRKVRVTAASRRGGDPEVLATSIYLSPTACRQLAERLTEAAAALEAEKPYEASTLNAWDRVVRAHEGTA